MVWRLPFLFPVAVALCAAVAPPADRVAAEDTADLTFDLGERADHDVAAAPAGPAVHEFAQAPDGLFYVQAKVGKAKIHFIVDSGASVVVLTPEDAARVGIDAGHGAIRAMQTSGGLSRSRSATLSSVAIAGQTVEDVDAVVVDSNLKVSLLGQSVLSRLQSVSFEGQRLRLN